MNNNASTLQGYQCAAAAAAAAASSSKGDLHGVKVYHCSKPGTADNALHESVKQELRALQRLRFHPYAVQLCAEGELVTAACGDMQGATGSQSSQPHSDGSSSSSSSKRSKKPQNPGCAVLELCARSLQDVLLKRGHISESIAKPVAASLVQLLAYCQSGQLDCVIVHRNLKPANIFIRKNTSIAVANFGACHIVELLEVAGSAAGSSVAAGEDAADAAGAGRKRRHDEQQHPAAEPDPAVVAAAVAVRMHDGFVTPFYAAPDMYSVGAAAKPTDAAVSGSGDDDSSANTTAAPAALQHAGAQQGSSSNSRPGYDASVDVFALGVIVVEMLLGSLPSVFPAGPPRSAQQAQVWEQWLGNLVDGQVALPEGLQVSPAALQFIGCCCGVGRERGSSSAWRGKAHAASAAASSSMAAISDVLWFWMTSETL
jgi:serine/threonine protein kinase